MVPNIREEMLRVRMSSKERQMLNELAQSEQLTASEYVRHFVRKEHELRFGARKPKPKK